MKLAVNETVSLYHGNDVLTISKSKCRHYFYQLNDGRKVRATLNAIQDLIDSVGYVANKLMAFVAEMEWLHDEQRYEIKTESNEVKELLSHLPDNRRWLGAYRLCKAEAYWFMRNVLRGLSK